MRIVSLVSFILMLIGALNWLLVGISRFDLVRWAFGRNSVPGRVVYSLVGAAGITQLVTNVIKLVRGRPAPTPT